MKDRLGQRNEKLNGGKSRDKKAIEKGQFNKYSATLDAVSKSYTASNI
jgi:hypothetical protein